MMVQVNNRIEDRLLGSMVRNAASSFHPNERSSLGRQLLRGAEDVRIFSRGSAGEDRRVGANEEQILLSAFDQLTMVVTLQVECLAVVDYTEVVDLKKQLFLRAF